MFVLYWFSIFLLFFNLDQSLGIGCDKPTPIEDNSQLSLIQSCQIVNGDLVIQKFKDPLIELTNLEKINGNLIIKESAELVRVEAPKLTSLNELKLSQLTSLSLVSFPNLRNVNSLNWQVIPILSNIRFSSDVKDIENIVISDTSLTGFSGFQTKVLRNLDINNNRFLETINSNVESITGKLKIVSNASNLKLSLPDLKSVDTVSINDVEELNLSGLKEINSSISLINNHFQKLLLENLTSIGGTLSISDNTRLSDIDLKNLKDVRGGLMIINNTDISQVDFLKKLRVIDGGLEVSGNLEYLDFPELKLIKGSVKIKSTNKKFNCNKIIREKLSLALRGGKITCESIDPSNNYRSIDGLNDLEDVNNNFGYNATQISNGNRLTPIIMQLMRSVSTFAGGL